MDGGAFVCRQRAVELVSPAVECGDVVVLEVGRSARLDGVIVSWCERHAARGSVLDASDNLKGEERRWKSHKVVTPASSSGWADKIPTCQSLLYPRWTTPIQHSLKNILSKRSDRIARPSPVVDEMEVKRSDFGDLKSDRKNPELVQPKHATSKGFSSLPFEVYERIFDFLRADYINDQALELGDAPHLPVATLVRPPCQQHPPGLKLFSHQSPLPLICRRSYPAGQAALLQILTISRSAVTFTDYLRTHPGAALGIRHLRIQESRTHAPILTTGPLTSTALYWLDRPRHFVPLLELCTKLESVHLSVRSAAPAWECEHGRQPIALPATCKILSLRRAKWSSYNASLLDTLALNYRVAADTVRFECATSEDLIASSPHAPGTPRRRFISARHLVIDVKRDNPNVYHPGQFGDFLASLTTIPRALTIRKLRLDSSAFRAIVQHCGPSLDFLHFTWSTPASEGAGSCEIIDYLYGGRYNPLIVGTVLLPCRNLREVRIDIVDLIPLRGMRFPASVRKLTLQWWTARHFFTEFFPWLQNHLCTDSPLLETLTIKILPNWSTREYHDADNARRAESEIVQLVDDYCIAKAATRLCENHNLVTEPASFEQAWKSVRKLELADSVWREVCRRLGTEMNAHDRKLLITNPLQTSN